MNRLSTIIGISLCLSIISCAPQTSDRNDDDLLTQTYLELQASIYKRDPRAPVSKESLLMDSMITDPEDKDFEAKFQQALVGKTRELGIMK